MSVGIGIFWGKVGTFRCPHATYIGRRPLNLVTRSKRSDFSRLANSMYLGRLEVYITAEMAEVNLSL